MKKALVLYWHGLGDVIILSPVLRELHKRGYVVDLMCREAVRTSHLLDSCIYVDKLITVENPWQSPKGFSLQANQNIKDFKELLIDYDWWGQANHMGPFTDKIVRNFEETRLTTTDYSLEVFIPDNVEELALKYIEENYPDGYIFNHTMIEFHPAHKWDSSTWIKDNLPSLPIIDTGVGENHYKKWEDIRISFVLAREATHRVLSSSVFVHACDAMGVDMEVINYGKPDRKVWVRNQNLVKRIREFGKFIK